MAPSQPLTVKNLNLNLADLKSIDGDKSWHEAYPSSTTKVNPPSLSNSPPSSQAQTLVAAYSEHTTLGSPPDEESPFESPTADTNLQEPPSPVALIILKDILTDIQGAIEDDDIWMVRVHKMRLRHARAGVLDNLGAPVARCLDRLECELCRPWLPCAEARVRVLLWVQGVAGGGRDGESESEAESAIDGDDEVEVARAGLSRLTLDGSVEGK